MQNHCFLSVQNSAGLLFPGGISTWPACPVTVFRPLQRKRHRLRLIFCLIFGHRLPCRLYSCFALSKPVRPIIRTRCYRTGKMCWWWTWAESNRRPERSRSKGVTTILVRRVRFELTYARLKVWCAATTPSSR